ncbi:MAG TPA: transposase [Tepidisphaeraceae bacterium]|nr:transposase [Tepidisphaeraceae bacterium]
MARKPRHCPGGLAYHVMNRTWGKIELFEDAGDYLAFEKVLAQALEREGTLRLCAYCLMPNHFHLVLWPKSDGQLSRFMQWLSMTHAQRWHAHRHSGGRGHLYQSRFKSFPIQKDEHFLSVCRYVERNPLRAGLVKGAELWPWSSLGLRGREPSAGPVPALSAWPVEMPPDWAQRVNLAQDDAQLNAIRASRDRGRPLGDAQWASRTAARLGIESSMRAIGRPKRRPET